ncbi:DUF336 domain-containing protein [Punctularia strigosozonata HHB-11173 SS5]|uniref:DUF336 domain-containing protein n=1 Tax=Punctularia strigosozonata (strain HHB-11173) TaxID=741275 RepID=UPI00044177AA|nr:DUF336 domain-containing protein [Punctularia strigosozonata HHB-11173 SS5]EIN06207.1 DUF336 domain-containing protein [Punctularia strigosozonata HHB-11173 SS5]
MAPSVTKAEAPTEPSDIASQEQRVTLPSFTADTAWEIGVLLRERLVKATQTPVVISIATANGSHLLFHCATHPGTAPDNDHWVARKRNTVLRFGCSTWYMHNKFKGDEDAFARKYGLGERAGEYAIHGGGVPIRVKGVEGVVGVVVVSGLAQNEDHQVVIECLDDYLSA